MPEPYSEEWWLRLDARNALRKAVESVRTLEPTTKSLNGCEGGSFYALHSNPPSSQPSKDVVVLIKGEN